MGTSTHLFAFIAGMLIGPLLMWVLAWYRWRRDEISWMETFASEAGIQCLNQSRESYSIQTARGGRRATDPRAPRPQVSSQGRPRQ